jgi:hypothetical protein
MNDRSFQKLAAAAAMIVGVTSLLYGGLFLTIFPAAQRSGAPGSLQSFNESPAPLAILSILLALGGIASTAAVVGVYRAVREGNSGLALWSFGIGTAYGVLTALQAAYQYFVANALSAFFARPNPAVSADAVRAAAAVVADLPSPVNTYGFSKFFLSGLWLLIVGVLMLRTNYFPRALGYLAIGAGVGVILLFIGQATNSLSLVLATGVPGSAIVGPIFWLWTGYTLWTKE